MPKVLAVEIAKIIQRIALLASPVFTLFELSGFVVFCATLEFVPPPAFSFLSIFEPPPAFSSLSIFEPPPAFSSLSIFEPPPAFSSLSIFEPPPTFSFCSSTLNKVEPSPSVNLNVMSCFPRLRVAT